jgi:hypothetical protein
MKRMAVIIALAFVANSQACAQWPSSTAEYNALMATGKCWGECAYRATMEECISCGLCYHGETKRAYVVNYCHKLQPRCRGLGRQNPNGSC